MTVKIVRSQKQIDFAEKGPGAADYIAPIEYRSASAVGVNPHGGSPAIPELVFYQDGNVVRIGLYEGDVAYFLENGKTVDTVRA